MVTKLLKFIKNKVLSILLLQNNSSRSSSKKLISKANKVVFIVQSKEFFISIETVINKMIQSSKFDPIILIIPSRYSELEDFSYKIDIAFFRNINIPIYNYDDLLKNNIDCLKQLNPNIVFRQAPWEHLVPEYFRTKNLLEYKLCYIPYGSPMTNAGEVFFNQPLHNYAWRIYCDIDFHYNNYKLYNTKKAINVVTVGDTKIEAIYNKLTVKYDKYGIKKSKKTKILWCPHHSMENWLGFCTFHKLYDDIYKFAIKNENIDVIFRPHPAMKTAILVNNKMTEKEYDDFFDKFLKLENVKLDERSNYLELFDESTLLISDGIAFLTDYLMTGKPIIFVDSQCNIGFNDYYSRFIKCWYKVINVEEIEHIINLVQNDIDDLKLKRLEFARELFNPLNNSPSDLIIKDLLNGLEG